jgi:protein TonB
MVRTLPFHHGDASRLLPQMRPGIAISIAVHAGLALCLAYALSFAPKTATEPDDDKIPFYTQPKAPPPKPVTVVKTSIFQPKPAEQLAKAPTDIKPLPLPPDDLPQRQPAASQTQTETAPAVINNPVPLYRGGLVFPERAAAMNQSGYVDFAFTIEPDGSVGDAEVLSESPKGYGFAAAARKAFANWKFAPKRVDGKPVAAPAQIRIAFQLQ